jgi:hypothetical protein
MLRRFLGFFIFRVFGFLGLDDYFRMKIFGIIKVMKKFLRKI